MSGSTTDGGEQRADFGGVFDSGGGFRTGSDIERTRRNYSNCLGGIGRGDAAGKDQRQLRMTELAFLGDQPIEGVASAAVSARSRGIEQQRRCAVSVRTQQIIRAIGANRLDAGDARLVP